MTLRVIPDSRQNFHLFKKFSFFFSLKKKKKSCLSQGSCHSQWLLSRKAGLCGGKHKEASPIPGTLGPQAALRAHCQPLEWEENTPVTSSPRRKGETVCRTRGKPRITEEQERECSIFLFAPVWTQAGSPKKTSPTPGGSKSQDQHQVDISPTGGQGSPASHLEAARAWLARSFMGMEKTSKLFSSLWT